MSLTNSPSLNRQIAAMTAQELATKWGGRFPTWDEFKAASKAGRIRVDKTVAAEAIWLAGMPKRSAIFYGAITIWLGLLLVPASIVAWLFFGWSAWWMLGAAVGCAYLVNVSRDGQCEVTKWGCERHRDLYEFLVIKGAFDFAPEGAGR